MPIYTLVEEKELLDQGIIEEIYKAWAEDESKIPEYKQAIDNLVNKFKGKPKLEEKYKDPNVQQLYELYCFYHDHVIENNSDFDSIEDFLEGKIRCKSGTAGYVLLAFELGKGEYIGIGRLYDHIFPLIFTETGVICVESNEPDKTQGAGFDFEPEEKMRQGSVNLLLASLYLRKGDQKSLLQALKLDPDHSRIHYQLSILKEESGNLREAIRHLSTGLTLHSKYYEKNDYYRLAHSLLGLWEDRSVCKG